MNLVLSSTGFNYPEHQCVNINESNLDILKLEELGPNSIDSLIVHRCLHLLPKDKFIQTLDTFFGKLKPGGKLTIYCIDVYIIAHKVHRREIGEADFDVIFYDKGQKNCLSTLSVINGCLQVGFKRESFCIEDIYAKMEFIK